MKDKPSRGGKTPADEREGKEMKEELRVIRDYGTVCGYTGKWLVQHRFDGGEWMTCYIADSEAEAKEYITQMPDWAK